MIDEYHRVTDRVFPLRDFSRKIYQMRMRREAEIAGGEFHDELECMEKFKNHETVKFGRDN